MEIEACVYMYMYICNALAREGISDRVDSVCVCVCARLVCVCVCVCVCVHVSVYVRDMCAYVYKNKAALALHSRTATLITSCHTRTPTSLNIHLRAYVCT